MAPGTSQSIEPEPITRIFRKSVEESKLAAPWKLSFISVIFKKGNKTMPGNYSPVSLTCILRKILEYIMREQLIEHMMKIVYSLINNIGLCLADRQYYSSSKY